MKFKSFALAMCALVIAGASGAQTNSSPVVQPSGSVSVPAADPSSAFKELAAQAAAEKWLGLIDSGEYAKTWEQSGQLFRERVTREQWTSSLPTTRAPFGAVKSRKVDTAAYKTSLPGAPDGEYVTVRFTTVFEKKEKAEELVTLSYEGGVWRPAGYFIR